LNILQVCPRYYPDIGGLEEHVRNISEVLCERHVVTVATTDPSGKLPYEEKINSVTILRFKSWAPSQSYFFSGSLKHYLKANAKKYDIVHAHSYSAMPALYAAQTKVPNLIFTSHYHGAGHTFFRNMLHYPYRFFGKSIFQNADRVISVSEYEKKLILKNFSIKPEKITVIPNGVNVHEFEDIKKQPNSTPVMLYIGRLEKYKGIHYLISVLPKLDKTLILKIIGSGPYKKNLIEQARQLGAADRVIFLDNLARKDLLQEYANADLFVSLSLHEAYGLTVAESLMSGVPCLVANSSALTEWVDNERCFGIDLPIDTDELASKIKKYIGKKIVKPKLLDWRAVTELTEKVYTASLL
jgi:glycosyltransferase involved in cell wall biosynthesis